MAKSISDVLVICDMDGTLLNSNNTISKGDLETIRLFKMLGGHFTVATGRTYASVAMYPELLELIEPAITCGGAVIYDFKQDNVSQSSVLPPLAAKQALRDILFAYTDVGAMVTCEDLRLYKVECSSHLQELIVVEQMTYFGRPAEELPMGWNKILFAGPEKQLAEIEAFVAERTYPGVYFHRTNQYYYEMMPKGVSKGSAIHMLCDMLSLSVKNSVVIGDYYNDLDMMKQAGYAVAMKNAPQEVQEAADEITSSNDECGVGQYLYRLINSLLC